MYCPGHQQFDTGQWEGRDCHVPQGNHISSTHACVLVQGTAFQSMRSRVTLLLPFASDTAAGVAPACIRVSMLDMINTSVLGVRMGLTSKYGSSRGLQVRPRPPLSPV